jgi:hypothetical protein
MKSALLRRLSGSDRACGAVATVAAIFLYFSSAGLPLGTLSAPDAGFFPKSLSAMLVVLGFWLMLQPHPATHTTPGFSTRSWAVPLAASSLLAYAGLLDKIGFVLCTVTILFFLMTAYGRLRWIVALAISLSAVAVCYMGFTELGVPLPQGVLTAF